MSNLTPEEAAEFEELRIRFEGGESPSRNAAAKEDSGWSLEGAAKHPLTQGILGFGDALHNMPKAAYSSITGQQYNPIKTGQGMSYDVGNIAGDIAPWFIPGPHQATIPARLLTGAVAGGLLNPENQQEGINEALKWGAIAEAIPYAGKFARGGIDKLVRKDLSQDIMNQLSQHYSTSKEKALSYLNPLLDQYGAKNIYKKGQMNMSEAFEENSEWLGPNSKKLWKRFQSEPTFKNSHDLQSALAKDMREVSDKDPHKYQAAKAAREATLDSMETFLNAKSPSASGNWNEFRNIYREEVGPYETNKVLHDITQNKTSKITPKKLEGALLDASEGNFASAGKAHPISKEGERLHGKLQRSQLYQAGAGGLAGGLIGGPLGVLAGGAIGGAASPLARLMGSDIGNILLNDELTKALSKSYPYVRQAATGYKNSPPDSVEVELNEEYK